jgi:zinc protease
MTPSRRSASALRVLSLVAALVACRSSVPLGGEAARAAAREPAPPRVVAPRPWEHASSDIPVDPRIRFGALANGLRWAWAPNREPKERCYLRLHVDVGSLAEEESELGMAHFLEHMAFNGSRNFAPGTLIEWFQSHGMAFGADTNAHTSFSETVYKLDLPGSDVKTLREGLLVLRDFADGLLLAPDEIEREKGVIDGEERERDSASWRVLVRELDVLFDGTRVAERLPIGKREARARFTAENVGAFYRKWYRPDAMTLVAVGDLGELDPAPLFAELFGDMRAPAEPLPAEPPIGRAARLDHRLAIHEPEIPSVSLELQRLVPWEEEPATVAEWLEDLPLAYARSMLNLRFSELAKEEGTPFVGAGARSAAALEVFDGENLSITCAPEKWEAALAACEQELRRALQFGFRQAELDEVRAEALRGLDEAVERETTAHSTALLGAILNAAEERVVPTDARTRREILRPAIEGLTVAQCQATFEAAWREGELALQATGNLDLGPEAGARLSAAYEASAVVPVEAEEEEAASAFAYAKDPAHAGAIVERRHVEDLDFTMVRFANGVALDVKRTDFKEKQILVSARLGEGQLTLEPERSELEFVGERVFNGAGLEAHSEDDLRRLTAGKVAGVGFSVSEDAFVLGGSTTREDLALQLELLCAYLEAPGWRADGLVQFRRSLPLMYEGLAHQHQGPLMTQFLPAVFAGDPRHGIPTQAEAAAVEVEDVRAWLAPELAEGALEVSVVGDLDVEETIALAARTLGTLAERRDWRALEERRTVPAPLSGIQQTHAIDTQVPKSLVLIVFPIPDGIAVKDRRLFAVLSSVVNDRLRIEVREKLGAAYSPGSAAQQSEVYPGVGMLLIQAMADPDKVETLVEACLGVAQALAEGGVTEEETARLREPILKQRRDAKRTNGYWMEVVSQAHRKPGQLDDVRSGDAFFESYAAADLTPLARRYLQRERASILVVNPRAAEGQ